MALFSLLLWAIFIIIARGNIDCCKKRCRRPWSELTKKERDLYISGFKHLADAGVVQSMSKSHFDLFTGVIHETPIFLPWHRAFVTDLEDKIRAIGPKYECFALPYWDWSAEPTPTEVKNGAKDPFILRSGLGGDPGGDCIASGEFSQAEYNPFHGSCLRRNVNYADHSACKFTSPAELIDMINKHKAHHSFTYDLEWVPHSNPHICIGGNMGRPPSPDDPIFYLHHCFIDYLYALWQDCHNYDRLARRGKTKSESNAYVGNIDDPLPMPHYPAGEEDKIKVKDVLDLASMNVVYEKGMFWKAAHVDEERYCGVKGKRLNDDWWYDHETLSEITDTVLEGERRRMYEGVFDHEMGHYFKSEEIYHDMMEEFEDMDHDFIVHEWATEVLCGFVISDFAFVQLQV